MSDLLSRLELFILILIVMAVGIVDAFQFHQFGLNTDLLLIVSGAGAGGVKIAFQAGLGADPMPPVLPPGATSTTTTETQTVTPPPPPIAGLRAG